MPSLRDEQMPKFKIGDIIVHINGGISFTIDDELLFSFNNGVNRDCYEVTHLYCLEMYTNNGRDIEFAWVRAASKMDAIETAGLVVWNFHECISCSETTGITKLTLGSHDSVWGINLHQSDYGNNHNRIRDVKFRVLLST